jgi:DNA topoisomerase-1
MEEELDDIAEGKAGWQGVVREFYDPFHQRVEVAADKVQPPEKILDELCPRCPEEGREPGHLVEKLGRFGKFIGCSNYPECRYTRPVSGEEQSQPEPTGENCPECDRPLVKRIGRFGPFVGCSGYPDCKYVKKEPPKSTGIRCPQCGEGELVERRGRFGSFFSCSRYPECTFSVNQKPLPDPCRVCGGLVVTARGGATRCIACGRAWSPEGEELPEEEAKALVPKPRGRRASAAGSRNGTASRSRSRTKRSA